MAIKDYKGSNLQETYRNIDELMRDMRSNGYKIIEACKDHVTLDDGSKVYLNGNVR